MVIKQLTVQKQDDLKAIKKIDYTYISFYRHYATFLYQKSRTKINYLTKFILYLYPLFVVKNQLSGKSNYLTRIYRLTIFLSLVSNVVAYIRVLLYLGRFHIIRLGLWIVFYRQELIKFQKTTFR